MFSVRVGLLHRTSCPRRNTRKKKGLDQVKKGKIYISSSSSSSSPSSAVASWYCWYSDTRSFVGLSLRELHLVHAFTGVPVEESLAPEHSSELLGHTLEHLLDGGGVANESGTHLEALRGDVTHGRLDVVGDPLDEVRGVLVLHVNHLLVNLFGGHAAS